MDDRPIGSVAEKLRQRSQGTVTDGPTVSLTLSEESAHVPSPTAITEPVGG